MSGPRQNIVLIGSSGQARVVIDILRQSSSLNLVGLLDDFRAVGEVTDGYSVLGKVDDLPAIVDCCDATAVAIAVGDNWVRQLLAEKAATLLPGILFPPVIHPRACIASSVKIEEGCVLVANSVVNSGARLGRFSLVNTAASLDHDGVMHPYSSLAPGVHAGGNVVIGQGAAISIGAIVIQGRKIGAHSLIGAGAVVVSDIPERSVAMGVPARVVRQRIPGERYL